MKVYIGLFSETGKSAIIYSEEGQPKKFDNLKQANEFIERNSLGIHASPVEVYES